eukprot:gene11203-10701_t
MLALHRTMFIAHSQRWPIWVLLLHLVLRASGLHQHNPYTSDPYSSQAVDVCGPTVRPRGKTPQQCLISEESKTRLGNVDRDGRSPLNSVPDLTFLRPGQGEHSNLWQLPSQEQSYEWPVTKAMLSRLIGVGQAVQNWHATAATGRIKLKVNYHNGVSQKIDYYESSSSPFHTMYDLVDEDKVIATMARVQQDEGRSVSLSLTKETVTAADLERLRADAIRAGFHHAVIRGHEVDVCFARAPSALLQAQRGSVQPRCVRKHQIGTETPDCISSWPFQVALQSKRDAAAVSDVVRCSGALVLGQWVLASAHCIDKIVGEIKARIGNPAPGRDKTTSWEYTVVRIQRHANYDARTRAHNIALLRLDRPVTLSATVGTVATLTSEEAALLHETTEAGDVTGIVSGWGCPGCSHSGKGYLSQTLMLRPTTISPRHRDSCISRVYSFNENAAESIPETVIGSTNAVLDANHLLCTSDLDTGACVGDGSELLVVESGGSYKLAGVMLQPPGCSHNRDVNPGRIYAGLFTPVSDYAHWIMKTAGSLISPDKIAYTGAYDTVNPSGDVTVCLRTPPFGEQARSLDLVFLIDMSKSFGDDQIVVTENIRDIVPKISEKYTDVRVGLASFVDDGSGVSCNSCQDNAECCGWEGVDACCGQSGDYTFKREVELTSDVASLHAGIAGMVLKNGGDLKESQLMGLLGAAVDPQMGWRSGKADHLQVVVLMTDADYHRAAGIPGSVHAGVPNDGDHFQRPEETYPSAAQISSIYLSAGIVPIFAVANLNLAEDFGSDGGAVDYTNLQAGQQVKLSRSVSAVRVISQWDGPDIDAGIILYKGASHWQTCFYGQQVVASDTDPEAVTMNHDDTGGSNQEEILIIKLKSLPDDVTTAISFVNVYSSGKTFSSAQGLAIQLDDVSSIFETNEGADHSSLTELLRSSEGTLLARSSAATVPNMNDATGMLLGAFNRLSDGSWYFESILALAEGETKNPDDSGMQNAFNAYLTTTGATRAAEESNRLVQQANITDAYYELVDQIGFGAVAILSANSSNLLAVIEEGMAENDKEVTPTVVSNPDGIFQTVSPSTVLVSHGSIDCFTVTLQRYYCTENANFTINFGQSRVDFDLENTPVETSETVPIVAALTLIYVDRDDDAESSGSSSNSSDGGSSVALFTAIRKSIVEKSAFFVLSSLNVGPSFSTDRGDGVLETFSSDGLPSAVLRRAQDHATGACGTKNFCVYIGSSVYDLDTGGMTPGGAGIEKSAFIAGASNIVFVDGTRSISDLGEVIAAAAVDVIHGNNNLGSNDRDATASLQTCQDQNHGTMDVGVEAQPPCQSIENTFIPDGAWISQDTMRDGVGPSHDLLQWSVQPVDATTSVLEAKFLFQNGALQQPENSQLILKLMIDADQNDATGRTLHEIQGVEFTIIATFEGVFPFDVRVQLKDERQNIFLATNDKSSVVVDTVDAINADTSQTFALYDRLSVQFETAALGLNASSRGVQSCHTEIRPFSMAAHFAGTVAGTAITESSSEKVGIEHSSTLFDFRVTPSTILPETPFQVAFRQPALFPSDADFDSELEGEHSEIGESEDETGVLSLILIKVQSLGLGKERSVHDATLYAPITLYAPFRPTTDGAVLHANFTHSLDPGIYQVTPNAAGSRHLVGSDQLHLHLLGMQTIMVDDCFGRGCVIDGVCIKAGEHEEGDDCHVCLPALSLSAWSVMPDSAYPGLLPWSPWSPSIHDALDPGKGFRFRNRDTSQLTATGRNCPVGYEEKLTSCNPYENALAGIMGDVMYNQICTNGRKVNSTVCLIDCPLGCSCSTGTAYGSFAVARCKFHPNLFQELYQSANFTVIEIQSIENVSQLSLMEPGNTDMILVNKDVLPTSATTFDRAGSEARAREVLAGLPGRESLDYSLSTCPAITLGVDAPAQVFKCEDDGLMLEGICTRSSMVICPDGQFGLLDRQGCTKSPAGGFSIPLGQARLGFAGIEHCSVDRCQNGLTCQHDTFAAKPGYYLAWVPEIYPFVVEFISNMHLEASHNRSITRIRLPNENASSENAVNISRVSRRALDGISVNVTTPTSISGVLQQITYNCPYPDNCVETPTSQCSEGCRGALCAVCSDKYFQLLGKCLRCPGPDDHKWKVLTFFLVVFITWIGYYIVRYLLKGELANVTRVARLTDGSNTPPQEYKEDNHDEKQEPPVRKWGDEVSRYAEIRADENNYLPSREYWYYFDGMVDTMVQYDTMALVKITIWVTQVYISIPGTFTQVNWPNAFTTLSSAFVWASDSPLKIWAPDCTLGRFSAYSTFWVTVVVLPSLIILAVFSYGGTRMLFAPFGISIGLGDEAKRFWRDPWREDNAAIDRDRSWCTQLQDWVFGAPRAPLRNTVHHAAGIIYPWGRKLWKDTSDDDLENYLAFHQDVDITFEEDLESRWWNRCGLYIWTDQRHEEKTSMTRHLRVVRMTFAVSLFFLCYTMIAMACINLLQPCHEICYEVDGSGLNQDCKQFLRADYSTECKTTSHTVHMGFAVVFMFIYNLAIPAWFVYTLWTHKSTLKEVQDLCDGTTKDDQFPNNGKQLAWDSSWSRDVALAW